MSELVELGALAVEEAAGAIADALSQWGSITVPLQSSAIASAGYDTNGACTINFTDGTSYVCPPGIVSRNEFVELCTAESPGRYWNLRLRGRR